MAPPVPSFTPGTHAQRRPIRAADSQPAPQLLEERTARQRSAGQPLAFATVWNLTSS
jgi:hypothetical protein